MKIVSVSQMQAIEEKADDSGISYQAMMKNAGEGAAKWVYENYPNASNIVGLIGSGNNGGDTLVALRKLSQWGFRTIGFLLKNRKDDELLDSYISAGGSVIDISNNEDIDCLTAETISGSVILDGILGTGLKIPLRGQLGEMMGKVSHLLKNRPGVSVIAVDCPSGVDCDTGEASEETLAAEHTLTMAAVKQGLLKHPAREKSGQIHVIDIGIGELSKYISVQLPVMMTKELVRDFLPDRPVTGHKGTFGTCMVIAGTPNFTGAAYLAGKAAYLGGSGLVHLAVLEPVYRNISGQLVEAVWTILPDVGGYYNPTGVGLLEEKISNFDALVLGPGWGLDDNNVKFLEELLAILPCDLPTVFDADGLKLLRKIPDWWEKVPGQAVLTPHPGEMAIIGDLEISEIESHRWEVTKEYAEKWGVTLVLKGAETVISDETGRVWINPVSEPALATAGSGDVLSGLIGGLLAQGISSTKSAIVSTFLHAQAGVIAKCKAGTDISVTAVDILGSIAESISLLERE